MWDQGCHLFEPAGRVMTDPHILSTEELTAQRPVTRAQAGSALAWSQRYKSRHGMNPSTSSGQTKLIGTFSTNGSS